MRKKAISTIKWTAAFYCAIFTVATLANSIGALWLGQETNPDIHGHIILRAGVCLGIAIIAAIIKSTYLKGRLSTYIIVCTASLLLIIAFIWALTSGILWLSAGEVHPNAFRDLTRSIAIPFALIAVVVGVFRAKRNKKKEDAGGVKNEFH